MKFSLKFLSAALTACLCLSCSGCVFFIVGTAGAVGGYAVSRDTFEGVSSKGQAELMASAHKVLSIMGTVVSEEAKSGRIVGVVEGNHVIVDVSEINMTTSRLRVKARWGIFPRVGIAQEVFTKIMNQLD
jgi:hypothetical protein